MISPPNLAQVAVVRSVHGENFSQFVFRKIAINYLAESQELSEQLPKKPKPQK
jgi:hypothetical protein